MKHLSKTLHPLFFYGVMLVYLGLSIYFISQAGQPINTNYALASIVKAKPANLNKNRPGVDCACETTFKKSYPVDWSGEVLAVFADGEDIGVKRFDQTSKYKQFYVDGNGLYKNDLGVNVRVQGRLIGLTCAYANAVFGQCVGEVDAEKITAVKN